MSKHWTAGAVDQVRGSIKEAIGKITGNTKLEAEGAAEKATGKVKNVAIEVKHDVHGAAKK